MRPDPSQSHLWVRQASGIGGLLALLLPCAVCVGQDHTQGVKPTPASATPRIENVAWEKYWRSVEEDWLRQAQVLSEPVYKPPGSVKTSEDAAGACDGIKNGKYGFHCGLEANPWWQVDLGAQRQIRRLVVYNRLDYAPGLHNADHLHVLGSDDGKQWTVIHRQDRHFGGVSGAKPLELTGAEGELTTRFIRLQIPGDKPIFFHLDEVEVYGFGDEDKNLALHQPADQSSLSPWSTAKLQKAGPTETGYPVGDVIARGQKLALSLGNDGVQTAAFERDLEQLARRLKAEPPAGDPAARKALYLEARRMVRRLAFANPRLNFQRLLFVKRFTQETYPDVCLNHMPWVSRPGGDICLLASTDPAASLFATLAAKPAPTGPPAGLTLEYLLNDALGPGHVHGLDLWWDAERVVFGYAKAKSRQPPEGWLDRARSFELRRSEEPTHIFEAAIDGSRLRQLTQGEWSDLDPTYLPNGDIAFASERCGASLQCNELDKDETSCNLYVMHPDGGNIRRLTVTKDGDYLPHALDDGTIGYVRWEYQERGWANIQSIWTVHPDGTGADAIFKQHFNDPWALEDARSIPGSRKLVAIATGHHTLAVGPLVVVNPSRGVNEPQGIAIVTPGVLPPEGGMSGQPVSEGGVSDNGGLYSTPWALSEKSFLAAYSYSNRQTEPAGYALYYVDVFGNKELIYRDPDISCFIPIPLRPRTRPPILPDVTEPEKTYAVCSVANIGYGVAGVPQEKIRYLRISEGIFWPYDNRHGGQRYEPDVKSVMINWNPTRIIGTVPVEADGSAHFYAPVDTAVYFQILDENFMELRRMRSFISFQPGEVRGCNGCHESRAESPTPATFALTLAAGREPSHPTPPAWGQRPISFLRDVQPVFDRYCVSCHSGLRPAAGLDFGGGLTARHNRAYDTLLAKGLIARSNVGDDARITAPLAFGSHRSKIVDALRKGACGRRISLRQDDWLRLVTWIDANGPYHDGFIDKRQPAPPYDLPGDKALAGQIAAVHARRCAPCHKADEVSRLDWIDLEHPRDTWFLRAPLDRVAGGAARCGQTVYRDLADPDYAELLKRVRQAVQTAWDHPRRDLKALGP